MERMLLKYFLFYFLIIIRALATTTSTHPLDNLTTQEVILAKKAITQSGWFPSHIKIMIAKPQEPKKQDILNGSAQRQIFLGLYDFPKNEYFEAIFDPAQKRLIQYKKIPGVQPPIAYEEFDLLINTVKAASCWQEAMKKRGYKNFEELHVDGWAPGLLSTEELKSGARIMRAMTYYQGKNKNIYTRPVEGIIVSVDMNQQKVIRCDDYEYVPVASGSNDFDQVSKRNQRQGLHSIQMLQPQGPSYHLKGQELQWMNWKMRFQFNAMKGLELFQISYQNRSIIYKISLSEMLVPYGDASPGWIFRNAFDVGEYGLGRTAHSLKSGVDVPAYSKLIDVIFAGWEGEVAKLPAAFAIFERPAGILWKHWDSTTSRLDVRKSQELVLMFMTTVGNYDYAISYIFSLDGNIKVEAQLTGILLAKGTIMTETPCTKDCVPLVEKNIIAPPHQHFFNFRIDFDVDGVKNTPFQMDTKAIEVGKNNPASNAFEKINSEMTHEKHAVGNLNLSSHRMWKVVNREIRNNLNHPTGFALMPGENAIPYLGQQSLIRQHASFINHHMWFTNYRDEEQGAGGEYTNQSKGGDGLSHYISNDESLQNQDVVGWYTFGITHHPRPEEWPIMSVHKAGFSLIPVYFFNANPAMDVP